jgi:hypothetical protein
VNCHATAQYRDAVGSTDTQLKRAREGSGDPIRGEANASTTRARYEFP